MEFLTEVRSGDYKSSDKPRNRDRQAMDKRHILRHRYHI
jgi:hypothetical protein